MTTTHSLGFPRIGAQRELKFALEDYWHGRKSAQSLTEQGQKLRRRHWQSQAQLDWVPVGDFSFYDQVLDMSFTVGNVPRRAAEREGSELDRYFRVARGRSAGDGDGIQAGEMTKWFDTNYHYIVPELSAQAEFSLNPSRLLEQLAEAQREGVKAKPVIIGPVTYLWLSKAKDGSDRLDLLDQLLPVYKQLLSLLVEQGVEWVQVDEPILVTELDHRWQQALGRSYHGLNACGAKLLLTTYFGGLEENLQLACELPSAGLHIDAVTDVGQVEKVVDWLPDHKVLSVGIIDGRNIWKTDLRATLDWLEPLAKKLNDRLWLAPSCSLLHVPVDLESEQELDEEIRSWLAFAHQKLEELRVLAVALDEGREAVSDALATNAQALQARRTSTRVHKPHVSRSLSAVTAADGQRQNPYGKRAQSQAEHLSLPLLPTTTIGSFPQTQEIRAARLSYRRGELDQSQYQDLMKQSIARCIAEQEALGLDVLVHGEAERNDMVEYFGEQLEGYVFSRFGWVQSYGSRCVKPPIIFGDVTRTKPMTTEWIRYAQSLTDKPVKGMLTGPVTMLNWSFVRDDQPRSTTCLQLALAIREEVLDLERAGVRIIQIDEAALREGLPLRKAQWQGYLQWAVEAFRIAANGVADETQIHTHMCYSEFNDIITAIAEMDADVITIETSRSDMQLLDAFDDFQYPNQIGPGVYDIHSPNIPNEAAMVKLMHQAAARIPVSRLWINPDCGLKTRQWQEVVPALECMVAAARTLRNHYQVGERLEQPSV